MAAAPAGHRLEKFENWLCGLAIGLGIWLRVFRFWTPSLWLDELVTAYIVSPRDWTTFLERCRHNWAPPLYFLMARPFYLMGHSEFALRLPSVIAGLGAIAGLMIVLRRALGRRAALYGCALFALNSEVLFQGQDARMYSLALLASTASIYFFLRAIEEGSAHMLAAYAVTTLAVGYTHLTYSTVLLGQAAVAVCFLFLGSKRPLGSYRVLGVQAMIILLLLPLAQTFLMAGRSAKALAACALPPGWKWLGDFLAWPDVRFTALLAPGILTTLLSPKKLRPRNTGELALVGVAGAYVVIYLGEILLARAGIVNVLMARYVLPALLGAIILAAFLVARSNDPVLRVGICASLAVAALFQILVASQFGPPVSAFSVKQDWRGAIRWVQVRYGPGDVVLLGSGLVEAQFLTPSDPWAQAYLAAPMCGFYDSGQMKVIDLPLTTDSLNASPWTGPKVREQVRQANQVFVLINEVASPWDWRQLEAWAGARGADPPPESARFQTLQVRLYRHGPASEATRQLVGPFALASSRHTK